MENRGRAFLLAIILGSVLSAGCSGDKNGGGLLLPAQGKQTVTTVLMLATVLTGTLPPDTSINGYTATLVLPAGITVPSTLHPPQSDPGTVAASGNASGALVSATVVPATETAAGRVTIFIASGSGFSPGPFCTVSAESDTAGRAADFKEVSLDSATGFDRASGSTVSGLASILTLTLSAR